MSDDYKKTLIVKNSVSKTTPYGMVYLEPKEMLQLNLKIGDIIEIKNEKNGRITVGKLMSSNNTDIKKRFIYLNWFLQRNLLVNIGESVAIRKIVPIEAEEIEFMGFDKPIRMKNIDNLKNKLPTMIFTIGDILSFDLKGRLISLAVKYYTPECSAVMVKDSTRIICKN